MGNFTTYSDLSSDAPNLNATRTIMEQAYLRRHNTPTPLNWANLAGSAYPHTTNSLVDIGNCLGAIIQYIRQDLGGSVNATTDLITRGAYKSAFSLRDPQFRAFYASTGSTYDNSWWNGNPGNSLSDYTISNIETVFGLNSGSLQDAINGQNFVPTVQQQQQRSGGVSGIGGVLQTSSPNNFSECPV